MLPAVTPQDVNLPDAHAVNGLLVVPVTRLYDQGQMLQASTLLDKRMARLRLSLNPATAARLGLHEGEMVEFRLKGQPARLEIHLDEGVPAGMALSAAQRGIPADRPGERRIREGVVR